MTVLGFTVHFHTPFRVGAAHGGDGRNLAVDHSDPLPADHLKGLMRAAARDILGLDAAHLAEVFGGRGHACAWSWQSARYEGDGWRYDTRYRVQIDSHNGAAVKDHFVTAEQAWAAKARFTVTRRGILQPDKINDQARVLRAAGAAVHGLGGWRRRGLGWVGVRPDQPLTADDVAWLMARRHLNPGVIAATPEVSR